MNNEAYAAAPISDTTIAAKMARFHITLHSSRRYSPKSHKAVKNTMSNATRNPMPFHNTYGDRSSSAAVTSVLAIKIGVSIGNSSNGKSNSRIRACAEIDESAVPAIETPRLPRKNTSTSQGNTLMTDTLYITANTGSSKSSITIRNNVFAASFARKTANGSDTDNRSASSDSGSNVKLNSTSTMITKMIVVVSSSRDRNSVFSSLPSSTPVFATKLNPPSFQPTATVGAQPAAPQLGRMPTSTTLPHDLTRPLQPTPNSSPRHSSYPQSTFRFQAESHASPTRKSGTHHASSSTKCNRRRASHATSASATQSPANQAPSPAHPAITPTAPSAAPV